VDLQAYLQRIGYRGSLAPEAATLQALHVAHLQAVPFENLDVHLGRPILLDVETIYRKIVVEQRGGFCYELNGLFAWLLRELGFPVTCLAASDAREDGGYGPEFDHLTLLVRAPDGGGAGPPTRWLADVGWGDTFRWPLRLDEPGVQQEGPRAYRLERNGTYRILWQRGRDGVWKRDYRFTLQPRQYADFEGMCRYHQTSAESAFTGRRLCTLATPQGRVTLEDRRLITTVHGERQERPVSGEDEFRSILCRQFGINLGA
jgi:N-hydroxyarylamine O-acetyltransferase